MPTSFRYLASIAAFSLVGFSTAWAQDSSASPTNSGTGGLTAPVTDKPAPKKITYTAVNVEKPYIAITFDDGPHASLTPKLLDMLKDRKIKATFYVVGVNAAEYPEIIKRIVDEGHEIANHSWSHPNLAKMSTESVRSQFERTNEAIYKACGVRPKTMRPPYGSFREAQRAWAAEELGLPTILWAVDPMDWRDRNAALVRDRIVSQTKAGDIILCHDIHASTVNAMPSTLDQLLARGFQFATVTELIAMDRPLPPPAPKVKAENQTQPQDHAQEIVAPAVETNGKTSKSQKSSTTSSATPAAAR